MKAVPVDRRDSMQQRERSWLGMALKRSLPNGFERTELSYHAHACPEVVWQTIFDTAY